MIFYLYYSKDKKKLRFPNLGGPPKGGVGGGGPPLTTRGPVCALEPFKRGWRGVGGCPYNH